MSERCENCGAELYAGQQFCRRCGAPVRAEEAGEAQTRLLGQGGRETGGAYDPELTAPLSGGAAGTDPSMRTPPTAPQASFVRFNPTTPLEPAAARKERVRWLLPFVLGVALAGVGALLIYMQSSRQTIVRRHAAEKKVAAPPQIPPFPPEAVEAIKRAAGDARQWEDMASLAPMDEAGADTDDDETVVTKTYPLDADAAFVLRNRKGDITVEGWDKES
ncbi:MAG TPA: zinc ribbon domain-containing protein, partial [Pyrinomonadaceae bacterium]